MELNNDFLNKVLDIYGEDGQKQIIKAFEFAKKKHLGQQRDDGSEYITHPYEVANILIGFKADLPAVISGLLHDCIEDTQTKSEEIKNQFGDVVFNICVGLSKIEQIKQSWKRNNAENGNLRNMFVAMANDARVAFVKLANRLHNMQTLDVKPRDVQVRIAKETLDIYVPLAEMLGMNHMKNDLGDLSFRYLLPQDFERIKQFLDQKYKQSKVIEKDIGEKIRKEAQKYGIDAKIQSRVKSIFSFYKKTLEKGQENIYDVIAHRIIVKNVKDCYTMLGAVHELWKPVDGRIKDYIAQPKKNGYRSLHTTVLYNAEHGDVPFEIQIRTEEMHVYNEFGMAAHWMYKERGSINTTGEVGNKALYTKKSEEVAKSENAIQSSESDEFLEIIKAGFYSDSIFVFTPNLNVIELSKGSIVLDFAYAIHSNLGNKCVGAKVNGKMVPITTKLETGDVVEIQTSPAKTPSRDWLKIVNKSTATKIRAFFKKERRDENIKLGKEMLEEFAKRNGMQLVKLLEDKESLADVQNKYNLAKLEDVFAIVGYGGITASQVLSKMITKLNQSQKKQKQVGVIDQGKKSSRGVVAGGESDLYKKFAKCCSPIPGDEIVGYVSRGKGVTIHRKDCEHIKFLEQDRFICAEWSEDSLKDLYTATFKVVAKNSAGVLNNISNRITENKIDISHLVMDRNSKSEKVLISIGVLIASRKQLSEIINKISSMHEVYDVYR